MAHITEKAHKTQKIWRRWM